MTNQLRKIIFYLLRGRLSPSLWQTKKLSPKMIFSPEKSDKCINPFLIELKPDSVIKQSLAVT